MPKAKKKLKVDRVLFALVCRMLRQGLPTASTNLPPVRGQSGLHHPDKYLFSSEPRKTIWGFIKGDMVHASQESQDGEEGNGLSYP